MKEFVLNDIKELRKRIIKLHKKINLNNEFLEELKQDKKVLECIKLLEENEKIKDDINNINSNINSLINNNCNHSLLLLKDYNCQIYDIYNEYLCLECGELIESSFKLNNVIYSNISYEILKNDYYNYLLKYDEKIAIEIMLVKYSKALFNELIQDGINEIKALNLVKVYEKRV